MYHIRVYVILVIQFYLKPLFTVKCSATIFFISGHIQVKNRDEWRTFLSNKNYDELETIVVKKERNKKLQKPQKQNVEKDRNSRSNTPEVECDDYKDPGIFLGTTSNVEMNDEVEEKLVETEKCRKAIKMLAGALVQVAAAVDPKYLKKPLGKIIIMFSSYYNKDLQLLLFLYFLAVSFDKIFGKK